MPSSTKPLMDMIRNTPPPTIGLQESMRSIPPPPLCPPPLTILKMVPPPPLPSHMTRSCPPQIHQIPLTQAPATSVQSPLVGSRSKGMDPPYQDYNRTSANESKSKYTLANASTLSTPSGRRNICETFDSGSERTSASTSGEAADTAEDVSDADRSSSSEADELVIVLRKLVNLFTMTSQVKSTLARIRTKPDDTGMIHQVGRTRNLLETFREQLARRTVMLGRLIPPGTSGKPEIPREIRTKDPAGGDVSPQLETPLSPPEGVTPAAVLSLQALVSADADESSNRASRWGSRVKRRFLASTKPTRRHGDKLKGPTAAGGNWTCVEESLARAPLRTDSSEEEDNQRGSYISPGCYVIDRTGLPREGAEIAEAESELEARGQPCDMFVVPMTVMSEASKKKTQTSPTETKSGTSVACMGLDQSWSSARDLVPRPVRKLERSTGAAHDEAPANHDVDTTVNQLSQLNLCTAIQSFKTFNKSETPLSQQTTNHNKQPPSKQQQQTVKSDPGDKEEECATSASPRSKTSEEEVEVEEEEEEGGWLSAFTGFEEDWYISAEREERERERVERMPQNVI